MSTTTPGLWTFDHTHPRFVEIKNRQRSGLGAGFTFSKRKHVSLETKWHVDHAKTPLLDRSGVAEFTLINSVLPVTS